MSVCRHCSEVGVKPEGKWILAEGADAAGMSRSIPLEKALDDTIIAWGQNGEALRPEQGYPLRMLNPGWEGNTSVKWLRRLEIGDQPWHHREETSKYTDLMPDGRARPQTEDAIRGYGGVRIDHQGRRFMSRNARIWTLLDEENRPTGQAACFNNWWWLKTYPQANN